MLRALAASLPGALLLLIAGALAPRSAAAHEIPDAVHVQAYARPEGNTFRLLVRVPLAAMRDMTLPLRGPGYIRLGEEGDQLRQAAEMWIAGYLRVYEESRLLPDGRVTATRLSIPSDPSFRSYATALASVRGPALPASTDLMWDQALLDVLIEYPITSAGSRFSIEPFLAHLGLSTTTTLRFLPPDGGERIFQYHGDPGLVRLDPRWHQASATFVRLGFLHILEGIDHLLFLFCLVLPVRRLRHLIAVVTSFTVAHSITLIAAAMGMAPSALWFPPLIETLIALSILFMAAENIIGVNVQRRWLVAFGFGLIHGFGFSFLLTESLQFAGQHLVASLLAFNVGVELGQVAVLLFAIPLLSFLLDRSGRERIWTIILSALVAHTAWHWMIERGASLGSYDYRLLTVGPAFWWSVLSWIALGIFVGGVAWFLRETVGKMESTAEAPFEAAAGLPRPLRNDPEASSRAAH